MTLAIVGLLIVLALGAIILILTSVWCLGQNSQTLRDRLSIINAISPGSPRFWELWRQFSGVTYGEHLSARIFLCDPWKLYTEEIRNLIGK